MLDDGADINARDYNGRTPLHVAAAAGQAHTVQLLLQHGASPLVADRSGRTPIDEAHLHQHPDVIALFK
ncbi:ankyrin repeat domain-containing protein [Myxococcota bacterium]|nr:ankyrin repeat domain-containing protein [Myxococcota bacterium]